MSEPSKRASAPEKTIRLSLTADVVQAGVEAMEDCDPEWISEASLAAEVFRAMIHRLNQKRPASLKSIRFAVYLYNLEKSEAQ